MTLSPGERLRGTLRSTFSDLESQATEADLLGKEGPPDSTILQDHVFVDAAIVELEGRTWRVETTMHITEESVITDAEILSELAEEEE